MPADRLAGGYLYYDATADDARLVLTVARTAAAHGAAVANRAGSSGSPRRRTGSVDGAGVDADGRRFTVKAPGRRQRGRGVGRRDAGARRRDRSRPHPSGQGRAPHRAVGHGAQRHRRRDPGAGRQAQPVRRAMGAARRRHVRAHLHRHHRHRLRGPARRPAVHRRRRRLRARGRSTPRSPPTITPATSPAVWAGLRPLVKSAHERPHRRPVAPPPGDGRAGRGRRHHRRQADDVPRDGAGHGRRRCSSASVAQPGAAPSGCALLGADGYRDAARTAPPTTSATGTARSRREVERWSPADPALGEPLVPGQPYLRAEAVYAVRHEMATTLGRRADPTHPRPPVRPGGHAAAAPAVAACWPASSVGRRRDRAAGRRVPRRSSPPRRPTPARPATPRRDDEPTPPIELDRHRGALSGTRRRAGRGARRAACGLPVRRRRRTPSPSAAGTGGRWRCTGRWPAQVPREPRASCARRRPTRSRRPARVCDERTPCR